MGFTSGGLPNNGQTAHYQISYDDTLSKADGLDRANGLLTFCEQDFALMSGWFGGINLEFSFPLPVQITGAAGGAGWQDPPDFELPFGVSPTITLNPGIGQPVSVLRYLLVSEVTEMFMATQDRGWYENTTFFQGADEGSKGEGLSRFLGVQFQIASGLGSVPPAGYGIVPGWLNGTRDNFVDNNPDDNALDPTNGCTTCFIYYLHDQLGHGINAIINAAGSTLGGVYQNLTGRTDGWSSFIKLINDHYPPIWKYNPADDNIFPVSELTQFWAPNQITCGYSDSSQIFISGKAKAEVNISLTSDNPAVVSVPDHVTVPVGGTSTAVTFQTAAIAGPFPTKSVNVHATYAGQTITISVEVVPPRIVSLTLTPDTVTCGDSSIATVTLNLPSLAGAAAADLICGAPGFATLPVPPQCIIPVNQLSATFTITTPDIAVAFKTAHASIYATYSGSMGSATLTVKSRIIAGILNTLTVFPGTINGGEISRGTVTLVEAVPVATIVGLAALEPLSLPGGHLPLPGNKSSIASVAPQITIPAGETTRTFNITTNDNITPGTKRNVTIMAGAIVTKTAVLVVLA